MLGDKPKEVCVCYRMCSLAMHIECVLLGRKKDWETSQKRCVCVCSLTIHIECVLLL